MIIAKRTEADLQKFYMEARRIMSSIGYDTEIIPISLNGRLSRVLGRYFIGQKRIEVNKTYFLNGEAQDIMGTLIHEICHQVASPRGDNKHGFIWHNIAQDVTSKTPYTITRMSKITTFENSPYVVYCPKCGLEHRYARKNKVFNNIQLYKCGKCSNSELKTRVEGM